MLTEPLFPIDERLKHNMNPEFAEITRVLFMDSLTGLHNRRSFRNQLEDCMEKAERSDASFAIAFIDVDDFQEINQKFGHSTGDSTLIYIARIIQHEFRDLGPVFRYGGDTFCAILVNSAIVQARLACESLSARIQRAFAFAEKGQPDKVTVSIGYSHYPSDGIGISTITKRAYRALTAAKLAGRNRVFSSTDFSSPSAHSTISHTRIHCRALFGRHREWNKLQERFAACRNGKSQFAFLTGESGSGKTRFLNHFTRSRQEDFCYVFHGFDDSDPPLPLTVLRNALSSVNPSRGDLRIQAPEASRVFSQTPIEPSSQIAGDPEQREINYENSVFHICSFLQTISQTKPVVLMLDGLSGEDSATLQLLQHLARNYRSCRLMVLISFASGHESLPLASWFISTMEREGLFENIELQNLSMDETRQMVSEIFKTATLSDSLFQWVFDQACGNPLYIEDLLQMAIEEGQLEFSGGSLTVVPNAKQLVPDRIRIRIIRRIQQLTRPLQQILGYVAALGEGFEEEMLMDLMADEPEFRREHLQELKTLGFLTEGNSEEERTYQFTKPMIRDVIYEEMGRLNRRIYHERITEMLERWRTRKPLKSSTLAYHYSRTGNSVEALRFLQEVESHR